MVVLRKDNSEIVQYTSKETPVYVQRGVLSNYPNYEEIAHWHNDIELIYVTTGAMQFNINGNIISLSERQGLFINSKQVHYGFSDHIECEFICVLFDPFLLPISEYLTEKYILPITENESTPYLLFSSLQNEKEIQNAVESLYAERDNDVFGLKAVAKCLDILGNLFEVSTKKSNTIKTEQHILLLKKMLLYIEKNYSRKVDLEDIAYIVNISKSTCGKIFNRYLHKTPIDYLKEYRLRKAEFLLISTDWKIIDISLEVGFQSVSFFIETFRKFYGISPNAFRKLHCNFTYKLQ